MLPKLPKSYINKLIKRRAALVSELEQIDSLLGKVEAKPATVRKKRQMSAEGRARIAEAQKKRWAAKKKAQG
jgi:hypothetical protein